MGELNFDRRQTPYSRNRLATAALVLGLITAVLSLIPYAVVLTWLPGLLALIFGLVAGIPARPRRSIALLGAILGLAGWLLGLVITISVFAATTSSSTSPDATQSPAVSQSPSSSTASASPSVSTPSSTPSTSPSITASASPASSATASSKPTAAPSGKVSALTLLSRLTVRAETNGAGYSRERFQHWVDANGNGHDARAEVLARQSEVPVTYNSSGGVTSGRWRSAYDGLTVTIASQLDVDHMVPLAEAWRSGAASWNAQRREAYANDLGYGPSLIAVTARENRSKSDSDPTGYLPPLQTYVCTYVSNWVAIKSRWNLAIDPAEKQAITRVLTRCASPYVTAPGEPKISELVGSASSSYSDSDSSSSGSGSSSGGNSSNSDAGASTAGGKDPRYGTCAELKGHANHAPYKQGVDPEYEWYQDRDGDGLACE